MSSKKEDIRRGSKIIKVFFKKGFGYYIHKFGLKWHLPFLKKITARTQEMPDAMPLLVREAFEELGGAFVKLGQFLSLRPDLVPQEYCDEFRKLLDKASPLPYETIKKVIESELNNPAENIFLRINKNPLGSASVAQVHKAVLKSKKNVVIKVQRPNIRKIFEEDLDIMKYIALKMRAREKFRIFNPVELVEEFERYTKKELDFINEAKNIQSFYEVFKQDSVIIPKVYWTKCTKKVLVMEFIDGVKLSEVLSEPSLIPNYNPKFICECIATSSFVQIFQGGIFHADMHPGNILVLPKNRIALLDYGIVGGISKELRDAETLLLGAIFNRETDKAISILLDVCTITEESDLGNFELEIKRILNIWYVEEKLLRPTIILQKMYNSCISNKIKIPTNLILLAKCLLTVEGTCLMVYPGFDFVSFGRKTLKEFSNKQRSPEAIFSNLLEKYKKVSDALYELPETALETLEQIKRARLSLDFSYTDIRHLGLDIETSSNRISFALLIMALIIAGALLIDFGPKYEQIPVLSTAFISIAMVFLGILFTSVLKEKSRKYDPHRKI